MRPRWTFALLALALVGIAGRFAVPSVAKDEEAPLILEVTSTADETGGSTACPDDTRCTLRRAIEVANASAGAQPVEIRFAAAAFPGGNVTPIRLRTQLPALQRDGLRLHGRGAVVIDGTDITVESDGLRLTGARAVVTGLHVRVFNRACLAIGGEDVTVGGDRQTDGGNTLDACPRAIDITGAGARVVGNTIGLGAGSKDIPGVDAGILVRAAGVEVGPSAPNPALANVVGNAAIAIAAGGDSGEAYGGIVIRNNLLGRTASGGAAPNGIAVQVRPPVVGLIVEGNTVVNAPIAGVQLTADSGSASVAKVTVRGNTFARLGGLAIDLGADGVRDAADAGDVDTGPNGLINAPVIDQATQAVIAGTAGSTCVGCTVELYIAEHLAGTTNDYGRTPIAGGLLTTGGNGEFRLDAPPVTPGTWVIATVTDADGNTSEFGPAARIGAGLLQCGNVRFERGWNHAGYFGTESIQLGANRPFPSVRAIYRLVDGGESYLHWLAEAPFSRTLQSLDPGESYWFLVDDAFTLPSGFSLTLALPAVLQAGWNDFVYFGPTIPAFDALGTAAAKVLELYRYVNDGTGAAWRSWGSPETPAWAREFHDLDACGVYAIRMSEGATLQPPQP
ncbi:MAG: CSLREA domain-containing protein [Dehalococcoidia bacterium]